MILNQLINYCDRNNFFEPDTNMCKIQGLYYVVKIDINGNFIDIDACKGKKGDFFMNPCTPDSAKPSGSAAYKTPNPFFNMIKYIFPDKLNYSFNEEYILDNMSRFNASSYSLPQTKAIEKFYRNSIMSVKDKLGESIKDKKMSSAFILFEIKDPSLETTHTWEDCEIKKNWSGFYRENSGMSPCECVISGEKTLECTKNPKINEFGASLTTSNKNHLCFDSCIENAIYLGMDSIQKINSSIDYLITSENHTIKDSINDVKDYHILFTDVQSKTDDDKIADFINSLESMDYVEEDCSNDDVDEKLVDYIKTNNYNESYIKNRNYNIYLFELTETSKGTVGILNEDIIPVETVFDSLDFWKKNFCYQTYDKETGGYVMKCPSYGFILRTVFGKNDKKDSMYKCIRQCLMNAILKNSLIPASVMKYIENKTLSLMGNYFENHYRIEKLENILLAMNTYNSKKTP